MPKLVIIAGPNGAGKSTSAPRLLGGPRRVDDFVNADVIAREGRLPDIAAGRIAVERLDELAAARRDIAFETTLSSRSLLVRIQSLRRIGYRCHLAFFWLPNAGMAIQRVAQRVLTGGHAIPEDVIRRRYERGLENFVNAYAGAVDSWELINNTLPPPDHHIALRRRGRNVQVVDNRLWSLLLARYMKPRVEEPVVTESSEDLEFDAAFEPEVTLRAISQAVQEAIDRHRARGEPIVVWRDGKVVWLQPGEY
jgi:predicted ABC-type ATPase